MINNYEETSKEELLISLWKSKQSIAELLNNNPNDDKLSDIRRILNRLRNILPKKYRKEILKKLYEIENNRNLSEQEKEEINNDLTKLVRVLVKKKNIVHMTVVILITMEQET